MTESKNKIPEFSEGSVVPEIKGRLANVMQTERWKTYEILGIPLPDIRFKQVDRDLIEPEEAKDIRLKTWNSKLEEKKEELKEAKSLSNYVIDFDEDTKLDSLFEIDLVGEKRRKMWAGMTVSLSQKGPYWEGNSVVVPLYPISYSEWIACHNPKYGEVFKEKGLPFPFAGFGISVLMKTKDDMIPLTVRGLETPVYPGMYYSPGGGPQPGESLEEAMLSEIKDEVGLKPGKHFNTSEMRALALVSDSKFAGSEHERPELIFYLPLKVGFNELLKIRHQSIAEKAKKEEDVWRMEPVASFPPELIDTIIDKGERMCAPTEAGLAHALLHITLQNEGLVSSLINIEKLMNRMATFDRALYKPQIRRIVSLN